MSEDKKPPFVKANTSFIRSEHLSATEKALYLVLKSYADGDPNSLCYPSQERQLKPMVGCSMVNLRKALKRLEKLGYITIHPQPSIRERNQYTVHSQDQHLTPARTSKTNHVDANARTSKTNHDSSSELNLVRASKANSTGIDSDTPMSGSNNGSIIGSISNGSEAVGIANAQKATARRARHGNTEPVCSMCRIPQSDPHFDPNYCHDGPDGKVTEHDFS